MEDANTNTGVEHVKVKKPDNTNKTVRNGLVVIIALLTIAVVWLAWPKGNTETVEVKPPVQEQKKENSGMTKEEAKVMFKEMIAELKSESKTENPIGTIAGEQNSSSNAQSTHCVLNNSEHGYNFQVDKTKEITNSMTKISGIYRDGNDHYVYLREAEFELVRAKYGLAKMLWVEGTFTINPDNKWVLKKVKDQQSGYYRFKIDISTQPQVIEYCFKVGAVTTEVYIPHELQKDGYPVVARYGEILYEE